MSDDKRATAGRKRRRKKRMHGCEREDKSEREREIEEEETARRCVKVVRRRPRCRPRFRSKCERGRWGMDVSGRCGVCVRVCARVCVCVCDLSFCHVDAGGLSPTELSQLVCSVCACAVSSCTCRCGVCVPTVYSSPAGRPVSSSCCFANWMKICSSVVSDTL